MASPTNDKKARNPIETSVRSSSTKQGQDITREQLSDVYAAGTSDGVVLLKNGTMHIPNTGYDEKTSENE